MEILFIGISQVVFKYKYSCFCTLLKVSEILFKCICNFNIYDSLSHGVATRSETDDLLSHDKANWLFSQVFNNLHRGTSTGPCQCNNADMQVGSQ